MTAGSLTPNMLTGIVPPSGSSSLLLSADRVSISNFRGLGDDLGAPGSFIDSISKRRLNALSSGREPSVHLPYETTSMVRLIARPLYRYDARGREGVSPVVELERLARDPKRAGRIRIL